MTDEAATAAAQRVLPLLDGIAIHVLAGHFTPAEGAEIAMGAIGSELRHQ
jgi:hypothetical protein